jgi:threonine synthase
MYYYSTNNKELKFGLRDALLKGLAPEDALFMPSVIPVLSREELEGLKNLNLT